MKNENRVRLGRVQLAVGLVGNVNGGEGHAAVEGKRIKADRLGVNDHNWWKSNDTSDGCEVAPVSRASVISPDRDWADGEVRRLLRVGGDSAGPMNGRCV